MVIWLSISTIAFIICVIVLINALRTTNWEDSILIPIISSVIGFIALLTLITIPYERLNYVQFERTFAIQEQTIGEITDANPEMGMNLVYVADIVSANAELSKYKARRELYGVFSLIPERVLDIDPIGVP